jgi:hypothetical protein
MQGLWRKVDRNQRRNEIGLKLPPVLQDIRQQKMLCLTLFSDKKPFNKLGVDLLLRRNLSKLLLKKIKAKVIESKKV